MVDRTPGIIPPERASAAVGCAMLLGLALGALVAFLVGAVSW